MTEPAPEETVEHWKGVAAAANRGLQRMRDRYLEEVSRKNDLAAFWQAEAERYKNAMVDFAAIAREREKEHD